MSSLLDQTLANRDAVSCSVSALFGPFCLRYVGDHDTSGSNNLKPVQSEVGRSRNVSHWGIPYCMHTIQRTYVVGILEKEKAGKLGRRFKVGMFLGLRSFVL